MKNCTQLYEIYEVPVNQSRTIRSAVDALGILPPAFACAIDGELHSFSHQCRQTIPHEGQYECSAVALPGTCQNGSLNFQKHEGFDPCGQEVVHITKMHQKIPHWTS